MDHLLFLSHRIPYPPNKGDKIRSYHILRHLSQRYHIHLASFIDCDEDVAHASDVKAFCKSSWLGRLHPRAAKLKSLIGLLTGDPLTLWYYRRLGLTRWIRSTMRRYPIRKVFVYSSALADCIPDSLDGLDCRVIDFVDVDSEKWRQYAKQKAFPLSWIYAREAAKLSELEWRAAAKFDFSLFVSESEAELFLRRAPVTSNKVHGIPNGVDTEYFSPALSYASPFLNDGRRLVFTGAMDYWPNEDGVTWLAREVLPELRRRFPGVELYVVGMNPSPSVKRLANLPGVVVTGTVPDIRPYLQHATAMVVPLRIARGIQNKVLEAMAMAKAVVATPEAVEGIPARPGSDLLVARADSSFVDAVSRLLSDSDMKLSMNLGMSARAFVEREFDWETSLDKLERLLDCDDRFVRTETVFS